jgi:hypothetical protein
VGAGGEGKRVSAEGLSWVQSLDRVSPWSRAAARLVANRIIGHAANRDDLGQARQLGWVPPSPAFLVRSALARRRLRRATA